MLRKYIPRSASWFERSMSYIQSESIDDCEALMKEHSELHLFGGSKDADAETLWRKSYDALDHPYAPVLHTIKDLENQVLELLENESYFLSTIEYGLLQRLLSQKGHLLVLRSGEIPACLSLIRRLWCYASFPPDGSVALHMPESLLFEISRILTQRGFIEHSFLLGDFTQVTDSILLWKGILPLSIALSELEEVFSPMHVPETIFRRFLLSNYDYTVHQGNILLIHPGLAEPSKLFPLLKDYPNDIYSTDFDSVLSEWDTPTKLSQMLIGTCRRVMRKDYNPQDLAADLTLLRKQGAPYEALVDTLKASSVMTPSSDMLDCIRLICQYVQPWPYFCIPEGN